MEHAPDSICLQHWIRSGDADAFNELAKRYSGIVFGTCLRITGNRSEAEDATQECFETLARVSEVPRSPMGAWLHRVATNRALNHTRANKRRSMRESRYANDTSPQVEAQWNDIHALLDEAIAELPEELSAPIVAHFLEGKSYTSVATSLGMSRQLVTYRVKKGIRLLRTALKKRGVAISSSSLMAMMTAQIGLTPTASASTLAALAKTALVGPLHQASAGGSIMTSIGGASSAASIGTTALGGIVMGKSTVVGIGAALAIVCTGLAYTIKNGGDSGNLDEKESRNSAVTGQSSASTLASLAELQDDLEKTEIARSHLQEELSLAEERIGQLESDAVSSEDLANANLDEASDEEESKKAESLDEIRSQFRGTDVQERTALIYEDFLSAAQLDTALNAKAMALLSESYLEEKALKLYARQKDGVTFRELHEWILAEQEFLNDQLRSALPGDVFATWTAYFAKMDPRHLGSEGQREWYQENRFPSMTRENIDAFVDVYSEEYRTQFLEMERSNALYTSLEFENLLLSIATSTHERVEGILSNTELAEMDNWMTVVENRWTRATSE